MTEDLSRTLTEAADVADKIRDRLNDPADIALNGWPYVGAIRAVLAIHKPMEWFEECMDHKLDEANPDAYGKAHRYVGEQGIPVCADTRQQDRCAGCTPDGADDDTVMSVKYPCPTVLALASGMGV